MNIGWLCYKNNVGEIHFSNFDSRSVPTFTGTDLESKFEIFFDHENRKWIIDHGGTSYFSIRGIVNTKRPCFQPPYQPWYHGPPINMYGDRQTMPKNGVPQLILGYLRKFSGKIVPYSNKVFSSATPESKKAIGQICRILGLVSALLKSPLPKEMTEEICKSLYIILI